MIDFSRPTAHPRTRIFRTLAFIGFGLYLILLIYFSLVPVVPGTADLSDKALHFLAYGGLTGLVAAAWPRMSLPALFIVVSLIGAIMEMGQGVLDIGRMASFGDQIANMSGAALAILIWSAAALLRHIIINRDKKSARIKQ